VADSFKWPGDVPGWLSEAEGRFLFEQARGKVCLEVGSFRGLSACCLLQSCAALHCVDPFDARATPEAGTDTLADFRRHTARYGFPVVHVGESAAVLPFLADRSFDLAFVDGAHDYEAVRYDAAECLRLVRPGGTSAFHDFYHDDFPEVRRGALAALGPGGHVRSGPGSIGYVEGVRRAQL
jgi:predicted O-methyltransferase YrrM